MTALLSVTLLALGLDIRYGLFSGQGCRLPVLMYHHFTDEPELGTMDDLEALADACRRAGISL